MAKRASSFCLVLYVVVLLLGLVSAVTDDRQDKQVYVVYMGSLPSRPDYTPMSNHLSILQEVTGESSITGRLVRSYKRSFNGFAARLTESEREQVAEMEGVVSVFPNKKLQLQTTASWDFMGLKEGKNTKRNLAMESDTIIGVIDTGVWPESESFSDKGFGPPPKKWKGVCSGGKNFTCNNKLIGARDYTGEGTRDNQGHGSHTASTAAGNAVAGASFFGIGNGTARGGVPAARVAAYKVCIPTGCTTESILSAFDDAIADGVDVISISIGDDNAIPYEKDPIAIGAFHAMAKGILTVNSAGNSGPTPNSVASVAPWILTVAASTTNREFLTKVVLENGRTLSGRSVNAFDLKGKNYPLVEGTLGSQAKGQILVSRYPTISGTAVATINVDYKNYSSISPRPLSSLSQDDFDSLLSYLNSTKSPRGTVLKTEAVFNQKGPKVASFSSRGPNTLAVDLLKPDITAPGVEILAAYSPLSSPSLGDQRQVKYSVDSGTSMSCPHVAGVAAYIKTFHPDWSPSVIHSAIMTTVSAATDNRQDKQVYVVYMGSLPSRPDYTPMSNHISILQEVTGESSMEGRLVRSYKRSFNGFAARLTESEREQLAEMEGVVSVFPNKKLQLQTTASWDFMGLKEGKNTKRNLAVESDTIVGVIDCGVWPESESFSGKGFGPPPKKWKGVCSGGKNFTCNNKLIGARDYTGEGTRDLDGHGTHTASTAAGNAVTGASFFGIGNGTARGGVPAARIAAYNVCTDTGCKTDAILSAFDDAIADGVDVISVSIGDDNAIPYEKDPIAIGAFHAMAKGIITVNAAGNSGPTPNSVASVAPWILTVAASTTNREFLTKVVIQNGKTLVGRSVNAFDLQGKNYPLVFQESQAKGKILVSEYSFSSKTAVATIIEGYNNYATISPRPLSALSSDDYDFLLSYNKSTKSLQGTVLKSEAFFNQRAPKVVSFSSRGPNTLAADLLKPDITAPGVEILAAYSPLSPPSLEDQRRVKYSVLSGTSMSCPHVAGVAAYIKTFHPDWSPSMIQSAIMTTVSAVTDDPQDKQVYIVYMGSLPSGKEYTPMSHHMSILQEITGESSIEDRLVRSYKRSFNGFAARLSQPERERMAEMEGVVSVFRSKKLQLQTTASWDFMGLKEGNKTKRNPAVESDTIIGVLDIGIWPESESFSDKGFGPPPKKWKGVCSGGNNFTCNNKLIGARDYTGEGTRDLDGHGSHTASTAAGNAVAGASFFGIGNGTARGGVPAARIAAYKVCNSTDCTDDAVLSAFDDAIADGVDFISISLGGEALKYEEDTTAIGAFHAMAKGILTVNSAGNSGPNPTTVSSVAPWILTVAASTTNREFLTKVVIQNGKTLAGRSVNAFDLQEKNYPLVFSLPEVKGNDIFVSRYSYGSDVAVATIINDYTHFATINPRPLSALSPDDYNFLLSYVKSTKSPQGTVLKTEAVFNQKAPKVASFSSRGPNPIAVDLLKPDITAPGVEILAAFSPLGSPSEDRQRDQRHVKYSVITGTSMACPHVTGVAAYIKTFHPDWSPAVIQSAIMTTVSAVADDPQDKQVYIVYMGSLPSGLEYSPMSHHMSILQEITGESSIDGRLMRSYKRSFNGFAARLSESERERIAEMEGVVSVFRSKKLQIQTTASWDFMGLKEGNNTKRNLAVESDTIIGLIDTGIWPESESFSDKGFGPPPKKWKGVCSGGKNFTCNNKLIGARDYTGEGTRDNQGHGTHTSSTAAGNAVAGASFFGIGNGTARGGVPAARIAAYKVCTSTECGSEAVLSAFDDAIADGVDLISVSLGGDDGEVLRYEEDTIAIGAFHAMVKGILTVNSAGNSGPDPNTVGSVAPWILTVAASTTNREFLTKVVLQNGKTLSGRSVNAFDLKGKNYPLIYGDYIEGSQVEGKILVSGYSVSSDVAVATIIRDYKDYASISSRPLSALSPDDFEFLVSYVNSTKSSQGTVLKTEADFNQKAPKVASFSSRGPNPIAVDLLKPDITAPGVEILAAYSPLSPPSLEDQRRVKYSVLSGTSMSCPHVAGVAAYIKTFHPDWSPSMIQSAIMTTVLAVTDDPQDKQVYIVYMGSLPSVLEYSPMSHHMSILQEITGESSIDGRLVRSYKRSFNGFAARLSEPEREKIAEMEGVVSVFRSEKLHIQTTASWDFMGLKEGNNTKRNPAVESDTIIGLIDTGIWPESESFSDKGFGPPPKKWKGVCSGGKNFTCNNKLIGARDYTREGTRDLDGHGSHTSSIAAGNAVAGTSFFGIGNGTARGGVPAARIAAYKVCTSTECGSEAVLSAFDDAIADGVDFISISIGGGAARRYEEDTTAIGAFHAMAKGILTVNSAGNSGPKPTSVGSVAPWILTVGASTTNREFLTKVVIQNGKTLSGRSVNAFDLQGKNYPLVFQGSEAKGKILVSVYSFSSDVAVATITKDYKNYATISSRPLSALSPDDFDFLVSYVNSTKSIQGTVLKTEAEFNQKAPKVASFSSRGPNPIAVDLLKPDITAPGVEILAAYSPLGSPTEYIDQRHVNYSVLSGTSMSCPHVTGVAAYIKTFHPDWSPSMIQSAIMTTAWSMNASDTGVASTEFAYGAGHVDPIAALNPGLVYELDKADHITFLCGLNYTSKTLKLITGEAVTCTGNTLPRNLNYPSMSAKVSEPNSSFTVTFNRTVTNLGTPNSTYKSQIVLNHGTKLSVKVSPDVLFMKSVNEKQSFTVTVSGDNIDPKLPSSASLIWSDGTHNVRSPIVLYTDVPNDSI
ncbi:unnamed protein product [Brassica rapa subsp. narinosa]